jgi:hypothetical protein
MDTSIALRIDANGRQWGGNNSPQEDRHSRRRQKLQTLLLSLRAGELEAARQAFTALVNFDPSASVDPYLSKIGAALQSSNLYTAQHFGQEIQNRGFQLQSSPSVANVAKQIGDRQIEQNIYSGLNRVDLSA